jgi:hypothetical protein
VIRANTLTIGQGDGGEGITVDGHIESDTFQAREQLYTPQGYVEDYTGNNITLTHTLTGNVIQANTLTIGQADGGEGITVDGHIESDTFQAREQLYTPQGYVEDYKGNNITLTHTLTGNVIQANTLTIGHADGGEGITVDGHIESDTFQAREQLYTPHGYVEDYTGNNITLTHTLTGNVIQANTLTIGQADGGEGITVDGHIESDTFQAREQLYTPQGYVEDYTGNTIVVDRFMTAPTLNADHAYLKETVGNMISVDQSVTAPTLNSDHAYLKETVGNTISVDQYVTAPTLHADHAYLKETVGNTISVDQYVTAPIVNVDDAYLKETVGNTISVDQYVTAPTVNVDDAYLKETVGNMISVDQYITAPTVNVDDAYLKETVGNTISVDQYVTAPTVNVDDAYLKETVGNTISVDQYITAPVVNADDAYLKKIVGNSISVDQSITAQANIQASNLTITEMTTLHEANVSGHMETNTISSNYINTDRIIINDNDNSTGIEGTFPAQADVLSGAVIDGDLSQFGGVMYGNGQGLTGFSGRQNKDLEERLRMLGESTYRLYVALTGSDTNRGNSPDQPFRTIKKACSVARKMTTIFVESGEYLEANPIYVPEQVSIVGDSLRNVIIKAMDPTSDILHVNSMTYFTGLRFVDLRAPGFCLAFPAAIADRVTIIEDVGPTLGMISASSGATLNPTLNVKYSPKGYYSLPLPGTATVSDTVKTKRTESPPLQVDVVKNSTLITFIDPSGGAIDLRTLFDTVNVNNSKLPVRGYLLMGRRQYQLATINSTIYSPQGTLLLDRRQPG